MEQKIFDKKLLLAEATSNNETANNFEKDNILTLTCLDDLLERDYPAKEWIVDKLIPEDSIVLLSAHPASYKTWLALELSLKVAEGKDFLDHFSAKQSGVLILDAESGGRQIQKRYKLLGANSGLPIYYKHFVSPDVDRDFMGSIIAECYKYDIKIVMFDSLTRFFSGNENDAGDISKFFENFYCLKQAGITSVIICHNRKVGGEGYCSNGYGQARNESFAIRGSSNILASCDMHLAISRQKDGNIIRVSQTKNRFDEELEPFTAQLIKDSDRSVHWEYLETQPSQSKKAKDEIYAFIQNNPGKNQSEICKHIMLRHDVSIGEKRVRALLKELICEDRVFTRKGARTEHLYYADNYMDGGRQNV